MDAPRDVRSAPSLTPAALASIEGSELFDADWYRTMYVLELPPNQAARHYLVEGAALGMNPGPLFDGGWYLANNADVAKAGANPLLHYLKNGRMEGRSIRLACTRDADARRIETRSSSYARAFPRVSSSSFTPFTSMCLRKYYRIS